MGCAGSLVTRSWKLVASLCGSERVAVQNTLGLDQPIDLDSAVSGPGVEVHLKVVAPRQKVLECLHYGAQAALVGEPGLLILLELRRLRGGRRVEVRDLRLELRDRGLALVHEGQVGLVGLVLSMGRLL